MHKNDDIVSGNKIAIIIGIFASIIVIALFLQFAYKEKNGILEESKKRGRMLFTQIYLTLLTESKSGNVHFNPAVLSKKINEISLSKGLVNFKFIKSSQKNLAAFEQDALIRFDEGDDEVYNASGNRYQYIAPIQAEIYCKKCHPAMREGNLVGGISLTFPIMDSNKWGKNIAIKASVLVLFNFIIIFFLTKIILKIYTHNITHRQKNDFEKQPAEIKEKKEKESIESPKISPEILKQKILLEQNLEQLQKDLENNKDWHKQEIGKRKIEHGLLTNELNEIKYDLNIQKNLVQMISHYSGEGIYIADKNGKITLWNSSAEKITGFSKEKMTGSILNEDIFSYKDKEGRIFTKEIYPLMRVLQKSESINTKNIYLKKQDGKTIPVRLKAFPVKDNQSRNIGAVIIMGEEIISEAKESVKTIAPQNLIVKEIVKDLEDHIEIMRDGDTGDLNEVQMEFMDELYAALKQLKSNV
ncbi:PAS domain-containing protein [Candidatus Desantisbacteria bacterium]|nr:PAS domain-containing protein [Candidatus Desantisbacteria bacterium]